MSDLRSAQTWLSRWWGKRTAGEKALLGLAAATIALSSLMPRSGPPALHPRVISAELVKVERQETWQADLKVVSDRLETVSREVIDAWEQARIDLERAWAEAARQ